MGKWTEAARAVKARMDERESLIGQLRAERDEARSLADRLRALSEIPHWGDLDSGASIKAGARMQYAFKVYVSIAPHTKALTRRPTNTEYWQEVE